MLDFLWQKCGKLKQQSPRGENATRWQLRITVLMWRGHWLMFWTSKIDLASLATHLPMQQHEASHWALAFILGTAEPHYYSDGRQVHKQKWSSKPFHISRRNAIKCFCTAKSIALPQTRIRQGRKVYMTIDPHDKVQKDAAVHILHATVSISTAQVQRTSPCGSTCGASLRPRNIADERKLKITIIHPKYINITNQHSKLAKFQWNVEQKRWLNVVTPSQTSAFSTGKKTQRKKLRRTQKPPSCSKKTNPHRLNAETKKWVWA